MVGSMVIECEVPFDQVKDVFLQQNPNPAFGTTEYALGLLGAANKQFGSWFRVILSTEDIQGIMLPPHIDGGFELISVSGSTVSDVVRRVDVLPPAHRCRRRIEEMSSGPLSAVFLSAAPVIDSAFTDYRDLVDRGFKGLTHLDGLHRLIAWARSGRSDITGYVAGLTSGS
jgi:uncharacterized protein DUF6309